MLRSGVGGVRWANSWELEGYLAEEREQGAGNREQRAGGALQVLQARPVVETVGREQAFEEAMFLGLRMNEGVDLEALRVEFGAELLDGAVEAMGDVEEAGLVLVEGERVRLTAKGRMASNEVFGRLLVGVVV
jgi:oxygen-independent coproporphyrinogen-3 oxidase